MLGGDNRAHFGIAAGPQNTSRIGEQPGQPNCAGTLVDLAVREVERALVGIGRAVRQNELQVQSFARRFAAGLRREALPPCQILRLTGGEINFNRVDGGNRRYNPASWGDKCPDLKLGLSRDAVDRSDEARELQINPCGFNGSLVSLDLRLRRFHSSDCRKVVLYRIVEILLAGRLLLCQRGVACDIKLSSA